jgi:hypothetical protein
MPQSWLFVLFALLSTGAEAQWLNYPTPGTPRTRDGKPNLSAPPPRASNGKPDLSGVWQTEASPPGEIERLYGKLLGTFVSPGEDPRTFSKYFFNVLADFKPEEAPIRPEMKGFLRQQAASAISPVLQCQPQGLPRADILTYAPFKIIQTPGLTAILYEVDSSFRQIYTDGRKLPLDPQPSWLGYSIGRWEGDTLVVDTAGFNDKSWLDGSPEHRHSEDMRIQERFHRRDFGHLDLQITIEDPKIYTKPITIKVTELLVPDSDILEYVCNENEKDGVHIPKP